MIVTLTHSQFRAVELRMPDLYGSSMREHRVTRGRTQHDYDMPAIAWRQILDSMMGQCFGPAGGKLKGPGRPSDSCYLAIRKIANAVRLIEGHPALAQRTVEGWVPDVVPAWRDVYAEGHSALRQFYCYPRSGSPFVLLVPQHGETLGMQTTSWERTAIPNHWAMGRSWTLSEESHLLFSRAPTAV